MAKNKMQSHRSITSAGHFRKPVRKSANPQIADLRFWFADLRTDFLPQTFAVKKLKSTANPQINSITEIVSAISKKKTNKRLYNSMYRQIWVDVFLTYNILSPSSSAVERLFPRGAAILTAK